MREFLGKGYKNLNRVYSQEIMILDWTGMIQNILPTGIALVGSLLNIHLVLLLCYWVGNKYAQPGFR